MNFQVRIRDELHQNLKEIARNRGISMADIVREALERYLVGRAFAEQGRKLILEGSSHQERTELIIPGFTRKP